MNLFHSLLESNMKTLVTIAVLFCMYSFALAQTGPIAYYPFNGNANDESGNGNNGTVFGATLTQDRYGISDRAYSFDGSSSYISIPNSASLQITGDITVCAWVKTSSPQISKGIIEKYYSGTQHDHGWLLNTFTDGGAMMEGRDGRGGTLTLRSNSSTGFADGLWHFLVGQRSGNIWKVHLDGQLSNSVDAGGIAGSIESGGKITIGAFSNTVPVNGVWYGAIDDIRIYDRALGNSEIDDLFLNRTRVVASADPFPNELHVQPSKVIRIHCSTDIDPSTLSALSIKLNGSQSSFHTFQVSYNPSLRMITINPIHDFFYGERVTVTLTSHILTTNGNPIAPHSFQFTIQSLGGTGEFISSQTLPTGDYPDFVFTADLNGDRIVDIAAANDLSQSITIFMNNGTGSFSQTQVINVGARPYTLAWGDFDQDGDIDIASANAWYDGQLRLFLNDGSGNFSPSTSVPNPGNQHPVATADFDGDGDLDIVLGVWAGHNVHVLTNDGTGHFTIVQTLPAGYACEAIETADIDGDGDMDFVVTNEENTNTLYVYKNNGQGAFEFAGNVSTGTRSFPYAIVQNDIDRDGYVDFLVANTNSNDLAVLKNGGTGSLMLVQSLVVGNNPSSLTVADFDGDGDLDGCVGRGQTITTVLNDGIGGFSISDISTAGSSVRYLASSDFDGDGDIDVASANFASNSISIMFNRNTTMPPTVTCSPNTVAEAREGQCKAPVMFSATATGLPVPEIFYKVGEYVIHPPYEFTTGTTTVTCTATNEAGSASCSFTVTVIDNQPPTITGPSSITVRPTSLAGAIVTYPTPVAEDNCSGVTMQQTTGRPSGAVFPIGVTNNTFVATDASGLTATHSVTVTVLDPYCAANKVNVCHNGHTICISVNALPAHLAHGDLLGTCSLGKNNEVAAQIPDEFRLEQNYPNPFNPATTISYELPFDEHVRLDVYNTLGEKLSTIVDESRVAGYYSEIFNASSLPSGVYFYRLQAGDFVATRRLLLIK